MIVVWAERSSSSRNPILYPAGKARLEPVGIILCAALMGMAALQLILESVTQLIEGFNNIEHPSALIFDMSTIAMLIGTIVAKIALWILCSRYADKSGTLMTLAVDHRNDVLSNIVAVATAMIAHQWESMWYADPIGAIIMSVYIAVNWFGIGREQIDQLVGRSADQTFIKEIHELAAKHHPLLMPDIIRAYHFGARFLVELEVVLPAEMRVKEAHDIALELQQLIEQLEDVEVNNTN